MISSFSKRPFKTIHIGNSILIVGLAFALAPPALSHDSSSQKTLIAQNNKSGTYQNWYPSSINLPNGLRYPCALTALPPDLKGIPKADKKYINHVYAMILKCVQAKTVMMSNLNNPARVRNAYSKYYYDTKAALDKIRQEPAPKGLGSFRNQVVKAIMLQMTFFDKASRLAAKRTPFNKLMAIPEGKQASSLLRSAWGKMANRYPSWSHRTKDSIYHHLCALDLF